MGSLEHRSSLSFTNLTEFSETWAKLDLSQPTLILLALAQVSEGLDTTTTVFPYKNYFKQYMNIYKYVYFFMRRKCCNLGRNEK